jgi:Domain of unknown function (DUF4185)
MPAPRSPLCDVRCAHGVFIRAEARDAIPARRRLTGVRHRTRAALLAAALTASCHGPAPSCLSPAARASTGWAGAEALFRGDASWLGGDVAGSVDLGQGRVLWLFGDSFVSPGASGSRRGAPMARNTVAVEHGYDPSHATIDFHYRRDASGAPSAFFPAPAGDAWYWPGPGVRLGDVLVVFLWRVHASPGDALGFVNDSPAVALVANPDDPPDAWHIRTEPLPKNPWGVFLGTGAALVHEGHLYLASCVEPGNHDVYLARWPLAEAARGSFGDPEWATDAHGGFTRQSQLATAPIRLFDQGHTELSVHLDPATGRFVEVQQLGFPRGDVVMRTAPRLEGPWSAPRVVYHPPEAQCSGVLTYAAKAHPELRSPSLSGAVAVTYATNNFDFAALVDDASLYFPRFVKLDAAAGAVSP